MRCFSLFSALLLSCSLIAAVPGCSDSGGPAEPPADSGISADRGTTGKDGSGAVNYALGHTSFTFVDNLRGNRQVPTDVYYPADTAGEKVAAAKTGGPFPVVVFGHGRMGATSAYKNFAEALVPRGYIVALPGTEMTASPDHLNFAKDFSFVEQQVRVEGARSGSLLKGAVGTGSALMGHSMGGATSLLAAAVAGHPFAGVALFAPGRTQSPSSTQAAGKVATHTVIFGGSDDKLTPVDQYAKVYYDALVAKDKALIVITGASHCQFSESEHNCDQMEQKLGTPALSRDQQHKVTERFLLPWVDAVLRKDATAKATFQNLLSSSSDVKVTTP